jgi:hypothetical protein
MLRTEAPKRRGRLVERNVEVLAITEFDDSFLQGVQLKIVSPEVKRTS